MSENNLNKFNCTNCGISFGLETNVVKLWRENHKQFWCPNGHSLSWSDDNEPEKELKELRIKIKSLEEQLATANTNLDIQTKLVAELQAELEIWKPNEGK